MVNNWAFQTAQNATTSRPSHNDFWWHVGSRFDVSAMECRKRHTQDIPHVRIIGLDPKGESLACRSNDNDRYAPLL